MVDGFGLAMVARRPDSVFIPGRILHRSLRKFSYRTKHRYNSIEP
jgi:hypothetical protein